VPADAVYGMSRVDASGRVAGQVITHVLGWRPGDRLTLTADAGVVLARRDPYGMVTMPSRCTIAIPAPLRHRCGLWAGDRVLLAALPIEDTLAAYTLAVVDQALQAHHPRPQREGGWS
jgi:bifunctional DNA-binding transcriptional regulator/antitoxin component of YhaV-PrlF toxin-antitoxin module